MPSHVMTKPKSTTTTANTITIVETSFWGDYEGLAESYFRQVLLEEELDRFRWYTESILLSFYLLDLYRECYRDTVPRCLIHLIMSV
jgi:hypothetical protein